ncbi:hypothetical protein ACJX0J_036427, partial [Zea mays]
CTVLIEPFWCLSTPPSLLSFFTACRGTSFLFFFFFFGGGLSRWIKYDRAQRRQSGRLLPGGILHASMLSDSSQSPHKIKRHNTLYFLYYLLYTTAMEYIYIYNTTLERYTS